ncbi:SOS response-associated peptidase [Sphingomonas sp. HDW15A]|uniref:SOS response-associated peptidase n=1 Tax=Sphingomonas sp. HDW15A TaxID=2714942 RepID=UPI00140D0237|nr:SOS response-associated peptidase family protein [Sphingomonas sp. HDW15A]QIK96396.1 SOS response-associated peptidase [Sphingomonas sp. HDW15A]
MTATVNELKRLFGPFEGDRDNLPPFDEIYPGKQAPIFRRREGGGLALEMATWGFPGPVAAKGRPVTNVRNLSSPFWRSALERPDRRCIVPVSRFCEWTGEVGKKRKVWFGMTEAHDPLFAFAGLWRPGAKDAADGPFMAFLTCEANGIVGAIHPKAMPVILRPTQAAQWLDGGREDACALAIPFADADMRLID